MPKEFLKKCFTIIKLTDLINHVQFLFDINKNLFDLVLKYVKPVNKNLC